MFTPDSLMPLLADPEFREQLAPFLPAGEELPQSPTELSSTLRSPQFQQVGLNMHVGGLTCYRVFDQCRVVQSLIKLTHGWQEFSFQFCNFLARCYVYIVCLSVLSCNNVKLHQMLEVKNTFKQKLIMLQLTFNPGLTLTGFQTTQPSALS